MAPEDKGVKDLDKILARLNDKKAIILTSELGEMALDIMEMLQASRSSPGVLKVLHNMINGNKEAIILLDRPMSAADTAKGYNPSKKIFAETLTLLMVPEDYVVKVLDAYIARLGDKNANISKGELGSMAIDIDMMLDKRLSPGVREDLNNRINSNRAAIARIDEGLSDAERAEGHSPSDGIFAKTQPTARHRRY